MKFSGREDIDVPIADVFARLTDFETHESLAAQRGIRSHRIDGLKETGPGMTWAVELKFRGKYRNINLEIQEVIPDLRLAFRLDGSGLYGVVTNDLVALARGRTRINVCIDVRPKNLTGRLLMQSLRVLKGSLDRRFQSRLTDYVSGLLSAPPHTSGKTSSTKFTD